MATSYQKKVKSICDEIYGFQVQQITIDTVQEIEDLLNIENHISREAAGAAAYQCDILLDVFNPKFVKDIDILTKLKKALNEWSDDIENVNILLGLSRES